MAAAANWVGATVRSTCRTGSLDRGRVNNHSPSPAVTAAAHRHSTAAISMGDTILARRRVGGLGYG
jgi:hypothetical protein